MNTSATESFKVARVSQRSRGERALRWAALLLHFASGLALVSLYFPFASEARRQKIKMRWAQGLLRLFAIQMRQVGQISPQALLVSNHISWLDIFVISAAQATCFVAKAEIRHWPLAGWLCAQVDTLFIERSSRRQAQHIAHAMAERLAADKSVAFFPEGTTSDGGSLLPFHAALFQPAVSLQASVQPLLIRYLDADGQRSTATAFIGEMSFLDSLRATLSTRNLRVELICLPVESSQQHDRRSLARTCQEAISQHAKVLQKN